MVVGVETAPVTADPPTPTGTAGADVLQLELSDSPPNVVNSQPAVPDEPDDPLVCHGVDLPGSAGEHLLQAAYGSTDRAARFYSDQVLDHLNPRMTEFVGRMEMAFVATSDAHGECDCSLRTGPPGFIQILDDRTLAYPEYRGNGVMASLGNISENPRIGVLMVDFVTDLIGLHVNGHASIAEDAVLRADHPGLPVDAVRGRTPERWVVINVVEAYVHCRKHIPQMVPVDRARRWGTDDSRPKGGDYFGAKAERLASTIA